MGKKQNVRKYGAPLYCAVWPAGDYALVAGGGGKKSSGIANRCCNGSDCSAPDCTI